MKPIRRYALTGIRTEKAINDIQRAEHLFREILAGSKAAAYDDVYRDLDAALQRLAQRLGRSGAESLPNTDARLLFTGLLLINDPGLWRVVDRRGVGVRVALALVGAHGIREHDFEEAREAVLCLKENELVLKKLARMRAGRTKGSGRTAILADQEARDILDRHGHAHLAKKLMKRGFSEVTANRAAARARRKSIKN